MSALLPLAQSGALFAASGMVLVFWIVGILLSIFWIWMLIDVLMSSMPGSEKILWFLVVFFLHILGALIYYFVRRSGGTTGTHRLAT